MKTTLEEKIESLEKKYNELDDYSSYLYDLILNERLDRSREIDKASDSCYRRISMVCITFCFIVIMSYWKVIVSCWK